MASTETLLVFLRHPEPGRAKTRLIPRLGPEGAAALYRSMAEQVLETARALDRSRLTRVAYFEPAERRADVMEWLGRGLEFLPQPDIDLGSRLSLGFRWAFDAGAERVVAIGTDCTEVTTSHLSEAFDSLRRLDAAVGPAEDGGYWLIGLSRPCSAAFTDIPWSTPDTCRRTLAALRGSHRSVKLLPVLRDVDRPEDLRAGM